MLLRSLLVAALGTTFLSAAPTPSAQAGGAGKVLGGVAIGAAATVVGTKVYKHRQRQKRSRNHYSSRKHHNGNRRYSGNRSAFDQDTFNYQTWLNQLGYNAGTADGISGRKTRNAISSFQIANGMPATGVLTRDQATLLSQMAVAETVGISQTSPQPITPQSITSQPITSLEETSPTFVHASQLGSVETIVPQNKVSGNAGLATGGTPVRVYNNPQEQQLAGADPSAPPEPLQASLDETGDPGGHSSAKTDGKHDTPYATVETRPAILGLVVGKSFSDTSDALKAQGFSSCTSFTNAILCERPTSFGYDKIKVAASSDHIHTITRKLSFNTPAAADTIFSRMPVSYKPLIDARNHKISASNACDSIMETQSATFSKLVTQSIDGNAFDAASVDFSNACKYYFAINVPEGETIDEVELTFFDSSPILKSLVETKAEADAPIAEIKF